MLSLPRFRAVSSLATLAREALGGVADVATLFPLLAALVSTGVVDGRAALFGVGLGYVASAVLFRVPMAVQPLKAMGALALAKHASSGELRFAAALFSVALAVVALTRVRGWLERVPLHGIHAIQAGLAALLFSRALAVAAALGPNERTLAALLAPLLVGAQLVSAWPLLGAVAVVAIGFGAMATSSAAAPAFAHAPEHLRPEVIAIMVASQLPLTLANSVVATTAAARSYFGAAASRVTSPRLLGSMAMSSAVAALSGGLPTCHGSGGLTAHVKGGAKTPWSTASFGLILVLIGVAAASREPRFALAPLPLALLLVLTAVHHAVLTRSSFQTRRSAIPVAVSSIVTLLSESLLGGIGAALAVEFLLAHKTPRQHAGPAPSFER